MQQPEQVELKAVDVVEVMRMLFPARDKFDAPMLNFYKRNQLIKPRGAKTNGTNRSDKYTFLDALRVAIAIELRDLGVPVTLIWRKYGVTDAELRNGWIHRELGALELQYDTERIYKRLRHAVVEYQAGARTVENEAQAGAHGSALKLVKGGAR